MCTFWSMDSVKLQCFQFWGFVVFVIITKFALWSVFFIVLVFHRTIINPRFNSWIVTIGLSLLLCMQIWEFFLSLYIYIYSSFLFHFMTHSKLYDSSAISYDSSNYYPDNLILLTNIFTSLFIHFSRCWRTHTQHRFLWDFILSSMKTALLFLPFISYLLNSCFFNLWLYSLNP